MDAARVTLLRELLAATGWVEETRSFARGLRRSARPGHLLLVGTPTEEPWHLAAHLDDEARLSGAAELAPTLVRWSPPPGAPPHLSVGLSRIEAATRGETLFVVAPDAAPAPLLERVSDARRVGATILAIDDGDPELGDLVHDRLVVPAQDGLVVPGSPLPPVDIDTVQHLVSAAAGESESKSSFRDRLARLLGHVSGPPPER